MTELITLATFKHLAPELIILASALIILVSGLFSNWHKISWGLGIIGLLLSIHHISRHFNKLLGGVFNSGIVVDHIGLWLKLALLAIAIMVLLFYGGIVKAKNWLHGLHEYIVIVLLATFGGMIAISARDFLILYVALELVALSSYILVSYDREKIFSTEAGVKYFILGALASCIMVFGLSFIYGFGGGSLSFSDVGFTLNQPYYSPGLMIGMILFGVGLLFKLSLAPFHFWTPDVYQGAPLITVAYLISLPKFVVLVSAINIINLIIADINFEWQSAVRLFGLLSIIVGSFGAIIQTSLKRLMGYSTILNMGFIALALSTASSNGYTAAIIYLIVYIFASVGILAILAKDFGASEDVMLTELAGFSQRYKACALAFAIFIFSIIGIPPLAGFFAKFYVISSLAANHYFISAGIALLLSVVAAFYYLNIIKIMYFEEAEENKLIVNPSISLKFLIIFCAIFTLTIPILQNWL